MHKIKREIGIVMLARARYAHGEFLAIFVKSVKTLKSHREGKNPQNGQKHLSFWQRPKFLKRGQIFRASKILPSDYGMNKQSQPCTLYL